MKSSGNRRALAMLAAVIPLLALFAFVAFRSGPLAPVPVTVTKVEERSIAPGLFGIGTVEARYVYRIGPTNAGRVKRMLVQVGERVHSGQLLAEMDPVDLDDRITAQAALLKRAEANVSAANAQLTDAEARREHAQKQARRYEDLLQARTVSREAADQKHQEYKVAAASFSAAGANLDAAKQELQRAIAENAALVQQRANLHLIAPVDGLIVAREANVGTTLVAGQTAVEMIDPQQLWINARFNQSQARGLSSGLSAGIELRSRSGSQLRGTVLRVEPLADAVTEETLAKVVFDAPPESLPPLGELAEVTVALPHRDVLPVLPNASIRRVDGRLGVLVVEEGSLRFAPVRVGATDLNGRVQILEGLNSGEQVVVYSERAIGERSRIKVVEQLVDGRT